MDGDGRRCPVTLRLSDPAARVFEQWQADNSAVDEDAGSLFKSFVGKMDGVVLRAALVAELASWAMRGGTEPGEVSVDTIAAAAAWVDDYAKPMAERVYGDAALPVVERHAAVLARYIRKAKLTSINKRELRRSPHKTPLAALREAPDMDAAVSCLVDTGWLIDKSDREHETPGRRAATTRSILLFTGAHDDGLAEGCRRATARRGNSGQ